MTGAAPSRGGKLRRHIFRTVLALALSAIAALGGLFARSDLAFHDEFSRIRLGMSARIPPDRLPVVVVIDGPALRRYGRWPWPRPLLAELLGRIGAGEPAAIGLDLLLTEPAPGDRQLAAAIRGHRVILAERLDLRRTGRILRHLGQPDLPVPELAEAAFGGGFIDFFPDADGVARRMFGRTAGQGPQRLSLAAALMKASGRSRAVPPDEFPLTIGLQTRQWPTVSAGEILAGRFDPSHLRGRTVLIGLTAPGISGDFYPVAVRAMGRIPGVYLHAHAYTTMAIWGVTRTVPGLWAVLLIVLFGLLVSLLPWTTRPWASVLSWLLLLLVIPLAGLLAFLRGWWWAPSLPMAAPLLVGLTYLVDQAAMAHRRERKLHTTFARFISPAALREILAGPEPVLGGEAREITVLFADLRGFTALAEMSPPALTAARLNEHLGLMSRIILARGGMIDKFLGDAVMGVFGAPLPLVDHRREALEAALAIRQALDRPGMLPPGIGIASGWALVGNVGSKERLEYTAVGDPVNLAARLEEMAGPNEIMAAESCFALPPGGEWESLGATRIRGREAPILIYRSVMHVTESRVNPR